MENSGWILEACAKLIAILSGLAAVISIDAVIIALVYACFTVPQFLFYDHVVANGKEEKMLNSNAFIRRKMVAYVGGYSSDVSSNLVDLLRQNVYFPNGVTLQDDYKMAIHCSLKGCMMSFITSGGARYQNLLSDVYMTASFAF
jgi:hypothetical protein